jgi:Fe-coproporphyrin III synthase
MLKRLLTLATHKIYSLPILVMMPHSRCNCRCVMCDIWKANHTKKELSFEDLQAHIDTFRKLSVREIVFSGGEALMHSNLWKLCALLRENKIRITLLSTGLLLENHVDDIVRYIDQVIISIDGNEAVHDQIRNIPGGYKKISKGIVALRKANAKFKISARCVLQRQNYTDFISTVRSAKDIGVDKISFLAADVTTTAFNHSGRWHSESESDIALSKNEVDEFEKIIDQSFLTLKPEYASGFIVESPGKMKKIVQYYKALAGMGSFPSVACNAPWVSAVIESNGDVMPCFFHRPYGNIYNNTFSDIINSKHAIGFRQKINITTDPICSKCVCSLKLSPLQMH